MRKQIAIGVTMLGLVLGGTMHARSADLRGFVVGVSQDSIEIGVGKRPEGPPRPGAQATQSVKIDHETAFVKWVTHQPWGQSTAAKRTLLAAGQCIDVAMRENADVAKTIRISVEPPTSLFDPCK